MSPANAVSRTDTGHRNGMPPHAHSRAPVRVGVLRLPRFERLAPYPAVAALAMGAVSAFAFEPVGWWPLLPVTFALLCELIYRTKTLRRGLLVGWAFGVGQFVIGLNWIATAFTYQNNMPAWLGWVAVVLVSLYLAVYPALATGLAWRFGRENRVVLVLVFGGAWAITEWLRATMFTGFPWNPAAAVLVPTPLITITPLIGTYGLSAIVILLGGAIWLEYYKKW